MRYRMPAVVLLGAVALAAAGCGGSSSSDASSSTDVTTATTEDTSTVESTATDTVASTDTTSGAAGVGAFTGKCKDLAEAGQQFAAALAAANPSGGGTADLQSAAEAYDKFADAAPEEIRGDLKTVAGMLATYAKELQGVDLSSGKVPSASDLQKIQEAVSQIKSADVTKAEQNISAWVTKNCTTK